MLAPRGYSAPQPMETPRGGNIKSARDIAEAASAEASARSSTGVVCACLCVCATNVGGRGRSWRYRMWGEIFFFFNLEDSSTAQCCNVGPLWTLRKPVANILFLWTFVCPVLAKTAESEEEKKARLDTKSLIRTDR